VFAYKMLYNSVTCYPTRYEYIFFLKEIVESTIWLNSIRFGQPGFHFGVHPRAVHGMSVRIYIYLHVVGVSGFFFKKESEGWIVLFNRG